MMTPHPSFYELRRELAERGYFRRRPFRIIGELVIFVAVTLIGIALLIAGDSILTDAVAMLLIAWSALGVSTNAHMASHGAISRKPWVNKATALFGYPFFLQVSLTYWHYKHIVVHHPNPNVVDRDGDADLAPYFAITEEQLQSASGFRRWFYHHQSMFLPILMFGNAFAVVIQGWVYLIGQLRDERTRQWAHWLDLAALLLHIAVWVLMPMAFFGPLAVIMFTIVRFGLTSYGMFALFAPAHFPAEAAMLAPDVDTHDPVLLQTATTVNFTTGRLGRLLCAGVEYQIEHHLFPSIPHVYYPEVSKLVRRYCVVHGYPYRTLGWWEGIWKSMSTFYRPKRVFRNAERAVHATMGTAHRNRDMAPVALLGECPRA